MLTTYGAPGRFCLQSEANDKFNELEEQLQQIKDQIKVGGHVLTVTLDPWRHTSRHVRLLMLVLQQLGIRRKHGMA